MEFGTRVVSDAMGHSGRNMVVSIDTAGHEEARIRERDVSEPVTPHVP